MAFNKFNPFMHIAVVQQQTTTKERMKEQGKRAMRTKNKRKKFVQERISNSSAS